MTSYINNKIFQLLQKISYLIYLSYKLQIKLDIQEKFKISFFA